MIFNLVHFTQLQFANDTMGRPVRFVAYLPEMIPPQQVVYSRHYNDRRKQQSLHMASAGGLDEDGELELQTSMSLQAVVDLAVASGYSEHCKVFPELVRLLPTDDT